MVSLYNELIERAPMDMGQGVFSNETWRVREIDLQTNK